MYKLLWVPQPESESCSASSLLWVLASRFTLSQHLTGLEQEGCVDHRPGRAVAQGRPGGLQAWGTSKSPLHSPLVLAGGLVQSSPQEAFHG